MPRYIPGAACWWPMIPKPPVIGAATSDAQAAVGIYWYIPAGQDTLAEPPLEGARLPSGGTTAGPWPVVSKCALREGRQKERSTQVIPGRSPFGSLLLVDHRLSGLCHFATNEPSANVYLGGETTLYTIHLTKMSQESHNQIVFDESSIPHYRLYTQDDESPRPTKQLTLWCTCF